MNWNYDNKNKEWYTLETVPYANDDFSIKKDGQTYKLTENHFKIIGRFKKLTNAKLVAKLLRNG